MHMTSRDTRNHPWQLRNAGPEDLPSVRALLERAELPLDDVDERLAGDFIVAERDGAVIGSAGVEIYGRYGLLRSVAVDPEQQRHGIGASLVADRLEWAKADGMISLFLLTVTPEYFERFGFQRVQRDSVPPEVRQSREFTHLCPDTATAMALPVNYSDGEIRDQVRVKYGELARRVKARKTGDDTEATCCSPDDTSCCSPSAPSDNPVSRDLYTSEELSSVPDDASAASLGCGNPTALIDLQKGEVVLDLGSGGGIDVLLSAKRVGPTGKAYGLDMTDDMLEVAHANQRKAGVTNAEFLKGQIEDIPLPDASVDTIISNCVINLSTDKPSTLREAYRVLRSGGRLAVSDIVSKGPIPESVRQDMAAWTGCLAGALDESDYKQLLIDAGFEDVEFETTRVLGAADLGGDCGCSAPGAEEDLDGGLFVSAFIRARKR
jgi:N-acetylglutamate synthase-like GNAT family acetyltransferase/SAM-dependent methyltransferase